MEGREDPGQLNSDPMADYTTTYQEDTDDPGLIPDPRVIHDKIKLLFSKVQEENLYFRRVLFQFWAPVTTGGRRLLTTSKQPFAIVFPVPDLEEYRLSSLTYQYNIDANRHEVGEDPTIISGAHADAFLNHLPELVLDTGVHEGCPWVRPAAYFVLPICDSSRTSCVGVVECAVIDHGYRVLPVFNHLNATLEKVDLSTFQVQKRLPYKTIHGLQHAKDEIEGALMNVCETLNLHLAQVWIAYDDENHVPFSSSLEDTQTKQMLALKLAGSCIGSGFENHKNYYDACGMLPLNMAEGLVGKTLQNYESRFCRDTSNLNTIEKLVSGYSDYKCSCFTICLRSIKTGDFDYAFEFFWNQRQNHVLLLESLLFTLKRCLPNFKFVSGAELGDELHIVYVGDSSGSEIRFFKIFEGNRLSQEASEAKCKTTPIPLPRADIENQFGKTMKEAAKNLNVSLSTLKRKCNILGISEWQGPNFGKRKANNSCKNQIDTIEEDKAIQNLLVVNRETTYKDENTLTIKAEYGDEMIKFNLPISLATFVAVEMKIGKKLKLNHATYKLKYLDEDEDWISMISDEDLKDCIKSWRNLNWTAIRLRVLPINTIDM